MSQVVRKRTLKAADGKNSPFRRDLQGLRAVAVTAVILEHLFSWPTGGYIGVDVFFVISGFLITGLMLREHERTGRISWTGFYRRRVRRILPVSIVVLAVTVGVSYLIFRAARFQGVLTDAVWSLLFASNWHFAAVGTNYLSANGPLSPLLHFWSLSLEEQFYIVWPIMVIGSLAFSGRYLATRAGTVNHFLGLIVVMVGGASFCWATYDTLAAPTWAYFSTFSRAWEFAVGALLAVSAPLVGRIPPSVRPTLSYCGLIGIAASMALIDGDSAFPFPWALLPVASSVLLVSAGIGEDAHTPWLLQNPLSVYVGNISYSLYLWHFPVIVLLAAVIPDGSALYYFLAISCMVALSMLSFHLVEDPVRRSALLKPRANRPSHGSHASRRLGHKGLLPGWKYYLTGSLAVLTTIFVALAVQQPLAKLPADQLRPDANSVAPPIGATTSALSAVGGSLASEVSNASPVSFVDLEQARLSLEITGALNALEWPELSPPLDATVESRASEWVSDGCLGSDVAQLADLKVKVDSCVYGDLSGARTAVILGDSIAISWAPAVRAALESRGWRIQIMTLEQCSIAEVLARKLDGSDYALCDEFRQWTLDQVKASHPDIVIVSSSANAHNQVASPDTDGDLAAWKAAMKLSLARLQGNAGRVVVLASPPGTKDLLDCATRFSTPADCVSSPSYQYEQVVEAERSAVLSMGEPFVYVPTEAWYCVDGKCPAFVGTTPIFSDHAHMTGAYSRGLAPVLGAAIGE